jgi:hypothetical protein
MQYDDGVNHSDLVAIANSKKPDAIVYIGACPKSFNRPVMEPDTLKRLREVAKTIHMCGDASDEPWFDALQEYDSKECFDCQVSIDGNFDTPIASFKNGIVKLTPINPLFFKPLSWDERPILVGVTGGHGHGVRGNMTTRLKALSDKYGNSIVSVLGNRVSYQEMADFMCRCRCIVNCPMRGSAKGDHVKGRVIETAWARACLLECSNPHTSKWFVPNIDYLVWDDGNHLSSIIDWCSICPSYPKFSFTGLHTKVAENHSPGIFWNEVFSKAGVVQ